MTGYRKVAGFSTNASPWHHDKNMFRSANRGRSAPWRGAVALCLLFLLTFGWVARKKVPVTGFFTHIVNPT